MLFFPPLYLCHLHPVSFLVQVVIDTDKSSYSLRFESREHLSHVVGHINYALSRIFNNSIFAWVSL